MTDRPSSWQLTASTAHLRGLIHLHQGANDLAKEAFIEALSRDVKCFESFEMLVNGEMMTHDEGEYTFPQASPSVPMWLTHLWFCFAEWEFVQGLPYLAQTGEEAHFIRMMYTVRLKKVSLQSWCRPAALNAR